MSHSMKNQSSNNPYPVILGSDKDVKFSRDPTGKLEYVATKMNYVANDTVEINIRRNVDGSDSIMERAKWDPTEVKVFNAREMAKTIHKDGFEIVKDPVAEIDYLDSDQVIDHYYPSCEELIRRVLGDEVEVVKAFDHNVRISNDALNAELKGGGGAKPQVPIGEVHGDYTEVSGPKRLHHLSELPKANDVLKARLNNKSLLDPAVVNDAIQGKRRFSLINVWRSIDTSGPIEEIPLACVDARSVSAKELKVLKIHYKDRIGENYMVAYDTQHKWFYFPSMTHDEALLIKQWDSHGDFKSNDPERIATFAVHSAFLDPTSPENARPRRSIEVRIAIIWKQR